MRKVTVLVAVLLAVAFTAPRVEAEQSLFQSMMDDPRLIVYQHGNVEVHSIKWFSPGDLEKMSLAWDLIVNLPRWPGLGESIPKPVHIYYVDGEKLYQLYRSRVGPCPAGQECSSSGYYEGATDQILINGDQRWGLTWRSSPHEMVHRMLGWVTKQSCTRFGWANFCQNPVWMNGMRNAVARLNREKGLNPYPATLQPDRYTRLIQILREDFFPGWPLEGVRLSTYEEITQAYGIGRYTLPADEWAARYFIKEVVDRFDSHGPDTYLTFGAAVDYVEAEVERICRERPGGC